MKFAATPAQLLPALSAAIGPAKAKSTMPILGCFLVEATTDGVTITANDTEIQIRAQAAAEVATPGAAAIDAKKIFDLIRALPPTATVTVTDSGEAATLTSGRSRHRLNRLPADNFPALSVAAMPDLATLPAAALWAPLKRTMHAAAVEDVRFYLIGSYLELSPGEIRVTCSDGHRMATCTAPAPALDTTWSGLLPRRAAVEIIKLLDKRDGDATLHLGANALQVGVGKVEFATKLIDGRFPDWRRAWPRALPRGLTADRADLEAAVRRVTLLFGTEKLRSTDFAAVGGDLALTAAAPDGEASEEHVDITLDGDAATLRLNAPYLLQSLAEFDGDTVRWSFTEELHATVLSADFAALEVVLMPMRV